MRGVPRKHIAKSRLAGLNPVEPAGSADTPPALIPLHACFSLPISRRAFLAVSAAALLVGCDEETTSESSLRPQMYMRSGRGRRVSRAAKLHNHNRRYATMAAAAADVPHSGDTSRIVSVDVSEETWDRYFGAGLEVVDLRWFQGLR